MRLIAILVALAALMAGPASALDMIPERYPSTTVNRLDLNWLSARGSAAISGSNLKIMDLHTEPNTQGLFASPNGALIDYCPPTGCLAGPHLLGAGVLNLTTRKDASAQEVGLAISLISRTGKAEPWKARTAYELGTQVHGPRDGIYEVTVAGASGTAGPTFCPRSTYAYCYYQGGADAANGTDGSVTWKWVGAGINDGKSAFGTAVRMQAGAGNTWSMFTALDLDPSVGNVTGIGYEQDTTNNNQDYPLGSAGLYGIFQFGGYMGYPGTAAHYIGIGNAATYAWHYGTLVNGDNVIKDATFADATSASSVFQALGSPHTHSVVFDDQSNAAVSLSITGNKTLTAIDTSRMTGTASVLNMVDGQLIKWGSHSLYTSAGRFYVGIGASNTPVFSLDGLGNASVTGNLLAASLTAGTISATGTFGLSGNMIAPNLPTSAGATKGTLCVDPAGNLFVKTTSGACL